VVGWFTYEQEYSKIYGCMFVKFLEGSRPSHINTFFGVIYVRNLLESSSQYNMFSHGILHATC